ncbi:MAG: hypothetical protein JXC32_18030 [Anaerolineae bacterium]|nr:hypothetical protein [Anaerolineae bacterium]
MRKRVWLLRVVCWLGAVIDGLMVVVMVFPDLGQRFFRFITFRPTSPFRYAMMMGASLMLGWTVLLIWAARKPLARKGVLLITAVPVVVGLTLSNVYAVVVGLIAARDMVMTWVAQALLLVLLLGSYFAAGGPPADSAS